MVYLTTPEHIPWDIWGDGVVFHHSNYVHVCSPDAWSQTLLGLDTEIPCPEWSRIHGSGPSLTCDPLLRPLGMCLDTYPILALGKSGAPV